MFFYIMLLVCTGCFLIFCFLDWCFLYFVCVSSDNTGHFIFTQGDTFKLDGYIKPLIRYILHKYLFTLEGAVIMLAYSSCYPSFSSTNLIDSVVFLNVYLYAVKLKLFQLISFKLYRFFFLLAVREK